MNKDEKNKRRELLALGLITGVGAISGGSIKKIITDAGRKKVKMITASGEVVEIEARHIPKNNKIKSISNAELKSWIEDEKRLK